MHFVSVAAWTVSGWVVAPSFGSTQTNRPVKAIRDLYVQVQGNVEQVDLILLCCTDLHALIVEVFRIYCCADFGPGVATSAARLTRLIELVGCGRTDLI